MGQIREHLAADLFGVFQPVGHSVEGMRQGGDLGAGFSGGHADTVVAGRQTGSGAGEILRGGVRRRRDNHRLASRALIKAVGRATARVIRLASR